ncbi:hypothetical protein B0H66DRAFT_614195 [Apodospora peruviana]|uniref:Uncharacterized protein n=1 Tax=Apodospora peruviana TaxID=516989 RepID=A0AAE0HS88_9PEZI|nr:hypothetical protein B0H66DRAFT_614195 [Apodospora peruviana]
MKLLPTIQAVLLFATLGSAAPTEDPPLKIVRIDMDAAALEARNTSSIEARAPVAGANLDAWNNANPQCLQPPTFIWNQPDPNTCYEYWSGGLRWKMLLTRYRPGTGGGSAYNLAVFDQPGCTGNRVNHVQNKCSGGNIWSIRIF